VSDQCPTEQALGKASPAVRLAIETYMGGGMLKPYSPQEPSRHTGYERASEGAS
jgi:hypothetical protein